MNSARSLTAVFTEIHTEERYFGHHTHTVNGLTAIRLIVGPDNSRRVAVKEGVVDGQITVQWGIRVWKRSSAGVETEITSGKMQPVNSTVILLPVPPSQLSLTVYSSKPL
jgi:hypothetical protein